MAAETVRKSVDNRSSKSQAERWRGEREENGENSEESVGESMANVDNEADGVIEMEGVQGEASAKGSVDKDGPKHLKKPARMPRELYQLYIDMVGFDEHNDAVRQ